jgi:hypothetical protein
MNPRGEMMPQLRREDFFSKNQDATAAMMLYETMVAGFICFS